MALGGAEPLAFLGDDMEQLGTSDVFKLRQHLDKLGDIVSVNGTEIAETQRLEQVRGTEGSGLGHRGGPLEEVKGFNIAGIPFGAVAAKTFPQFFFQLVVLR